MHFQIQILNSFGVAGEVRIEEMDPGQWQIKAGRNGLREIGLHSAVFYYEGDNPLALLRAGLEALDDWAFDDESGSPDMARSQRGARPALQAGDDRLYRHRPTFRGGQPEQPSGDEGG